ncbi:MAG: sigma-70 family RNA polymerase sigma factor [Chloroflexi bacterium]|nr:sigma-70 family RNA polymerase sigma factor [Chloroflexota bacterium]
MEEQALLQAAKQGDVTAFNEIVLQYQDLAYGVAYRILREPQTAADATQNAFISAYRKLEQLSGQNFKGWLLRIVTNTCYDELRRRKRHPEASLDGILEDSNGDTLPIGSDEENTMMAPVEGPELAAHRRELQTAIESCLQKLNDAYRIVAVLVDVEGMSYEEAAQIAEVSLGTVKSRVSRARAQLRDCLRTYGELLPGRYRLEDESN